MFSSTKSFFDSKPIYYLFSLIIVFGICLRLFHYLSDRSLWLDEGYLATSLLNFSYSDLLNKPLAYQQKAPIGFLLTVKLFLGLFGKNVMALRAISLLSGIFSIIIFIPVAKFFLKQYGVFVAVSILCLSPALIYHSVEIKQYSVELFCSILSFYLLIRLKALNTVKDILIWSLSGAILVWFSYSVIFILGGIGLSLFSYYLFTKQFRILLKCIIPFSSWLISFLLLFFFFIKRTPDANWVISWFRFYGNFLPFPPQSFSEFLWYPITFYRMLDYPLGLLWGFADISNSPTYLAPIFKMPFLPSILIFAGIYFCFKYSKEKFLVLMLPLLLVLIASGIEYYPLTERFWVFLSPIFLIFLGIGLDQLVNLKKIKKFRLIIIVLILIGPITQSYVSIANQDTFFVHKKSFQKEIFNKINNDFRNGDAVYVYWNELSGFNVYRDLEHYRFNAILGNDFREKSTNLIEYNVNLGNDFKKFEHNQRVWVVFNNKYLSNVGDPINYPLWYYDNKLLPAENLKNELNKNGKIIKEFITSDVTVYLYQLKNRP